jgi:hypothetical protein
LRWNHSVLIASSRLLSWSNVEFCQRLFLYLLRCSWEFFIYSIYVLYYLH